MSKDDGLRTVRELNIYFTRFISVSNALPKTSYVKMVDIFLLASLTVPFVEVRLFTSLSLISVKKGQVYIQDLSGATSNLHRIPTGKS